MKLIVSQEYNPDTFIQINLLSNPLIERWFNHCRSIQEQRKISGNLYSMKTGARLLLREKSKNFVNAQYSKLKELLYEVSKHPFPVSIPIPEIPETFNYDQYWCNEVHNVFLYIIYFLTDTNPSYYQPHADEETKYILKLANDINTTIHSIENYNNLTWEEIVCLHANPHEYLQASVGNNEIDLWFNITEEEQKLYHTHLGDQFYDVTLAGCILGKNYLNSYLQGEKINSPAVSGITGTWSSIEIALDNNRPKIYNSGGFIKWLGDKDLKTVPLEIPIGEIEASNNLEQLKYLTKLTQVRFVYDFVR
jgi:hypothetical protein